MAASDALPVPRKNVAFRLTIPVYDTAGALKTGLASADSEVSKDGAAFADCTNEVTEIGSTGIYYIDLTSTEMNCDCLAYKLTGTGINALTAIIYPEEAGDYRAAVTSMGADVITAAVIATGAIDADAIAADAVTEIQSGLATASALATVDGIVDDILVDTGSTLPATLSTIAGYIDTEVAAIKIVTDALPNAGALTTIQADLDDIQTRLPAALVSGRIDASVGAMAANVMTAAAAAADLTTELQSGLATSADLATVAGYLDTEVAAILEDTGTTLPAQIAGLNNLSSAQAQSAAAAALTAYDPPTKAELDAGLAALNNISAADVWAAATRTLTANTNLNDPTAAAVAEAVLTTAMTESYSADGAAPTLAQAMFLAMQMLTHMTIVGTTLTVYRLDGVTPAATFTLDSATSPTSITRAS